eukprot:355286-Chlamydomonas_euryale.AAC.3
MHEQREVKHVARDKYCKPIRYALLDFAANQSSFINTPCIAPSHLFHVSTVHEKLHALVNHPHAVRCVCIRCAGPLTIHGKQSASASA